MRFLLPLALIVITAPLAQAQRVPVTTDSDAARTAFEEGLLHTAHLEMDEARASFDAAIAADPEFALAHAYRASISPPAERQQHLDHAMAHKDGASEGERMMIDSYLAFHGGDPDREAELLEAVAERYPDDPYLPFSQGWRHYGQGRYAEAAAAAEATLEADPEFAPAYNMLGYVALAQGDHARSEEAFKNYVRLAPDRPNPYDSLGELYLNMGRYDEAAEQFEMALARNPDFTVSRNNLARAGIEATNRAFEAAFGRQDADALAALYTEDAALFPPDGEAVTGGRDALRAFWAGAFGSGLDGVELATRDVRSVGDAAYEQGVATLRAGGEVVAESPYTVLWKETDGGWRLHHDVWNDAPVASADATLEAVASAGGGVSMEAEASTLLPEALEWQEVVPGVSLAAAYGDWQAEPHGKFIRFDPGASAPLHTHTHPYHGVVISGRLTNPYAGEATPPVMGPGAHWYVPGGAAHSTTCVSEEPCLFYTYGDAAWDITLVE